MATTATAYLTGFGRYLPGAPVDNDGIVARLGGDDPVTERIRRRVLESNGIRQRHYALDEQGEPTELNEELAVKALRAALDDRGIGAEDLRMLATATTMGDVLVPGFASMVHGRLGGGPLQLLSASGVCASSLAALDAVVSKIRLGDHPRGAVVASEVASRSLRQRRYDGIRAGMDAHFLRWMLSDGAGAVVVEFQPHPDRPSLRVDWVRQVSLAHEHDVCMRAGMTGAEPVVGGTWQDLSIDDAASAGMFLLRQDVSMLDDLAEAGIRQFEQLVDIGLVDVRHLDHVVCHYSTNVFRDVAFEALRRRIPTLDTERWFSNLETRGNTGSASIFIALEEAWRTGRFAPGETVLLAVPESGRFSFAFAHLTVVAPPAL
ncbi:3-oxoacyl-[acyl-carrier-protein] synthase III C-terminal domain-containing protein [Microbacterium sp. M3]|uniref:3-oxoacyl-[acyl-carrier-protein] synthase III C-terminal domain-containing protein n=1 Tax=Microbacterium arthrosphaerae TaxID=792652 RepID=A0ABU4H2W3_9MICO|nr:MULTISPECIES: 3-oxoacyl-[acyl-carrier-protein] synthase III C-terminal domain-containing protein [Microbacterium]MDW4573677.1 3-oxoacyl-[acyl-carrier-protein] synthase III C-terminal domain-containing protein [Microbacterium arthrosphaerae]MDW7607532.1 3-oxoacyl-[acyl-carrier-protein] synthase III C-terminal domain-containing protein [Microbacterium sp. M3]